MATLSNTTVARIRAGAAQSGFLKKLFSQGIDGIPPASLITEFRQVMKLAGLDLPKDVVLSLDTMQIFLAGGAIVSDALSDAVEVYQVIGDVSNLAVGVANLLSDLGIGGEPIRQVADFGGLGVNFSAVISSSGGNVLADIGAVLSLISVVGDLIRDFGGSHDAAVAEAKQNLQNNLRSAAQNYLTPQVKFATEQMKSFQAGQLDYFDFVASIAQNSPVEFKNYFPNLACFFPSWQTVTITASGHGDSEGLFGNQTDDETASVHFQSLLASHAQVESVLFNYFIGSPLQAFRGFFDVSQGISIEAISIIAMILAGGPNGPVSITEDFDILGAIQVLGVTPSILGDDWLFKGLDKNELDASNWRDVLPYAPLTLPMASFQGSGISINGRPFYTPAELSKKSAHDELVSFQLHLQDLDARGDIDGLMQYPEAVAILKKWATFHPDVVLSGRSNPFNNFDSSLGPPINPVDPSKPIEISNYWKCLSVIKQMRASQLFQDESIALDHLGSIDRLNEDVKRVQSLVIAKQINSAARKNVSEALGTPYSNLGTRLTKNGTRVFYRKAG